MFRDLSQHFEKKDKAIAAWFKELHYHQKAVYFGIQNVRQQSFGQRIKILLSSGWKLKKPKLIAAAILLPFFRGDSFGKFWNLVSKKKNAIAL